MNDEHNSFAVEKMLKYGSHLKCRESSCNNICSIGDLVFLVDTSITLDAWGWKLSPDQDYVDSVQSSVFAAFQIFTDLLEYQLTLMAVPHLASSMAEVLGHGTG